MRLALAAIFLATAAQAEPFSLKGMALGDSAEAVKAKHPWSMCDSRNCTYVPRPGKSTELSTFGGGEVVYVSVYFDDGKLALVRIASPAGSAHAISSSLIEKFGPAETSSSDFKTQGGLSTTARKWQWASGDEELTVESPSSKITQMLTMLRSKAYLQKEVERLKSKAKADL